MALDDFKQEEVLEQQDPTPLKKEKQKSNEQKENKDPISQRIDNILQFIHKNNTGGFGKDNNTGEASGKLIVSKYSGFEINGRKFLNDELKVVDENGKISGTSKIIIGSLTLTFFKDNNTFTFDGDDGKIQSTYLKEDLSILEPIIKKMEAEIKKAQKFLDTQKTDAETKAKLQKVTNGQ